ncbi:MAG TPA: hypothetical protein VN620_10300, partial [Candidatus Methylomirabilis sp.]|nr:hypothetical protein [Candidatus Methylomirabilis sp.]
VSPTSRVRVVIVSGSEDLRSQRTYSKPNSFCRESPDFSQGLKPVLSRACTGTAEAVPLQRHAAKRWPEGQH